MRSTRPRGARLLAGALWVAGTLVASSAAVPAQAQGEVRIVSGTVVDLTDGVATISTNTGPMTVRTTPNTRYERQAPGAVGDLRPGMYVAVTGHPEDGGQVALQVRVFPAAQAAVPVTVNRPMEGPNQGNLMTNAVIQSTGDGQITVSAAGETITVITPPSTEVIRPEPGASADLREGRRIAVIGPMGGDGSLSAALVNVIE